MYESYLSAKQWLSRAKGIQARIDSLRASKERAYLRATASTAPLRFDAGGCRTGWNGYDANAAYVALSMEVERQEVELAQVCEEILYMISQVEDNALAVLLQEHYVNEKSLREIALVFHYSTSRAYQLHHKAVERIREILEFSLESSA